MPFQFVSNHNKVNGGAPPVQRKEGIPNPFMSFDVEMMGAQERRKIIKRVMIYHDAAERGFFRFA